MAGMAMSPSAGMTPATASPPRGGKPPAGAEKKVTTRAERREMQEAQRLAKAQRLAQEGKGPAPAAAAASGGAAKENAPRGGAAAAETAKAAGGAAGTAGSKVQSLPQYDDAKVKSKMEKTGIIQRTQMQKKVALFSHLPQYEREASISAGIKNSKAGTTLVEWCCRG